MKTCKHTQFNKTEYDANYHKTHYDQIVIAVSKDIDIKNRLKLLSIGLNKSVNQLLIEAVNDLLEKYNAWKVLLYYRMSFYAIATTAYSKKHYFQWYAIIKSVLRTDT